MDKLKDIKNIVEVVDYSLYYLFALVMVCLFIGSIFVLWLKKEKKTYRWTSKEIALKRLRSINYDDEKSIAYEFTLNIDYFIDDTNREKIEQILGKLEEFKYKKYVLKAQRNLKKDVEEVIKSIKLC